MMLQYPPILNLFPYTTLFRSHLGNLNQTPFSVVSGNADRDSYVQALRVLGPAGIVDALPVEEWGWKPGALRDRKSTRLNSSHLVMSYAVLCLKKNIQIY